MITMYEGFLLNRLQRDPRTDTLLVSDAKLSAGVISLSAQPYTARLGDAHQQQIPRQIPTTCL